MHIPDGFVSTPINLTTAALSAGALAAGLSKARRGTSETPHTVPLLAMTSAFVFAAQMLNFPIGGGTSGHFLGAVTAAVLLGPWNALVVMSVVLVIQGFFFADGGISALGTNIFNMGVIAGLGGWGVLRLLRGILPPGRGSLMASTAVASWLSVVLASSFCALELALSGTSPLRAALPAMAVTHAVIGIGEALIATAVITATSVSRPDLLPGWSDPQAVSTSPKRSARAYILAGLTVALVLAVFASPMASPHPDGLERVAEDEGFIARASDEGDALWRSSPFPDYGVGGIDSDAASTGSAGLVGTVAVSVVGYGIIRLLRGRRPDRQACMSSRRTE